jgi:inositol transport system substrate-binding protein
MKTKKYFSYMIIAVLMIGLVSACAPAAPAPASQPAASGQKYGLFMSHMTNAFTIEMSDAVKAKAAELGVEVTVYDGGHDPAKQASQIETAITQGITGIVIEPASVDGVVPAIEAATKAGIPVVVVNQKISKPEAASSFVGVSNVDGGIMEMKAAMEAIGGKGNVAFLYGPMGSDGQIGRTEGYNQVLKDYPDVKVAFEGSGNWKTDEALKLVENWLQAGTELSAIIANNDGMALGALKAVEDAQLQGKVLIFGLDATPDALAAVKDGRLAATVSQSTTEQGKTAMETVVKLVNGETVQKEILVSFTLIDKTNIGEYLK